MNYLLHDLPNSGENPIVYMDIMLKTECIGRIFIKLFREVFPAGVENFVRLIHGRTYCIKKKGGGRYKYKKEIRRTYEGCKFFNFLFNNYVVSGDIYNNNGTNAGTIYYDQPIPSNFGDFYYPHDSKGLISLVPFKDEASGALFYDSTFMITLDNCKPTNVLSELNHDQIVIGQIYDGLYVIDRINELIKPYAGRRYPEFVIGNCDVYRKGTFNRRLRPTARRNRTKKDYKNSDNNTSTEISNTESSIHDNSDTTEITNDTTEITNDTESSIYDKDKSD